MEDRETPRMQKFGESKTTRIMMTSYVTRLPVRDTENFRSLDFCWTEGTCGGRLTIKVICQAMGVACKGKYVHVETVYPTVCGNGKETDENRSW